MNHKFKFSGYHYDDSVDTFIKVNHDDSYVCVLFDVHQYISGLDTDEIIEFRKRYWLEEVSIADILHSEWCILEFTTKGDMEEYLYEVSDGYVYARFYNKGLLYEEICEREDYED